MAETDNIVEVLEKVPLFQKFDQRQLKRLANRFADREYEAGKEIVTQGREGIGLFIIASGQAEAVRERADGIRSVVNRFGPGDFFGEMALLDNGPRTASVIATEPTRCLVLVQWDFIAMLREEPDMAIIVLQALAQRFRQILDTM
ncbi:MAG TPA: cyclic nucleotide-binding domain-containing protein [Anaerolineae bacterium]|nr:cyclic nucleotide-binding domain-containing protein [Anaerolineae bacterium]HQK15288.1 cyclic nucleotide-binding domain-containing protein [Anaerolineae bacterium]